MFPTASGAGQSGSRIERACLTPVLAAAAQLPDAAVKNCILGIIRHTDLDNRLYSPPISNRCGVTTGVRD